MPKLLHLYLITVLTVLSIAAAPAQPNTTITTVSFEVGARDTERFRHTVTVAEPGCILAQVDGWSASTGTTKAARLALIINGADQSGYYARKDGSAGLVASYAVDAAKAARRLVWTFSVVNFSGRGTARGRMLLETPPTAMPCEFVALVGRVKGTASLRWRYTGKTLVRRFVAEQSENGNTWRAVAGCAPTQNSSGSYSCAVSQLTSGRTYHFRVCSITTATAGATSRCDAALVIKAPVVQIRAP